MIALLPIFVICLTILILIIVRMTKRAALSYWPINVSGALISWILMIFLRSRWTTAIIPLSFNNAGWYPEGMHLQLDPISWTFGFIAITILFSSLLTGAASIRHDDRSAIRWDTLLSADLLTCLVFFSASSGNLLTFLFLGGAALVTEWALRLIIAETRNGNVYDKHVALVRTISLVCIGFVLLVTEKGNSSSEFESLDETATILLSFAGALPLLTLNMTNASGNRLDLPKTLEPTLIITIFIPSLLLLSRTADSGTSLANPVNWLWLLCMFGFQAGFAWLGSEDNEFFRRWGVITTVFCAAAALTGQLEACLTWGILLLLVGAFKLQMTSQQVWLQPASWIIFLGLSSLPFTPSWIGAQLYSSAQPIWIPFLIVQGLLLACWMTTVHSAEKKPRWEMRYNPLIYGLGLVLLLFTWFGLSVLAFLDNPTLMKELLQARSILPGLLVFSFWFVFFLLFKFQSDKVRHFAGVIGQLLRLKWLFKVLYRSSIWIGELLAFVNRLLESKAGLLWAFLILVLFYIFIRRQA